MNSNPRANILRTTLNAMTTSNIHVCTSNTHSRLLHQPFYRCHSLQHQTSFKRHLADTHAPSKSTEPPPSLSHKHRPGGTPSRLTRLHSIAQLIRDKRFTQTPCHALSIGIDLKCISLLSVSIPLSLSLSLSSPVPHLGFYTGSLCLRLLSMFYPFLGVCPQAEIR